MRGTRPASARSQRGVALIVLAVLLVLGVTWFLVSGLSQMTHPAVDRIDNAEVLAQAKSALIGRMVTDASDSGERNPGRLPCPEAPGYIGTSNEGIAAGNCSAPAIGRLPWRTLGLPKLLDASGEPLWYVVSPGWALPSASATLTINSDSVGNLTVDGQANAAVALIVAPGGPIVTAGSAACSARTQQRGVTPPDVCNYLEAPLDLTVNPAATPLPTPVFTTAGPAGAFNDQVIRIAAADVVPPLEAAISVRMQRDLAPLFVDATLSDAANSVRTAGASGYYPFAGNWTNPADNPLSNPPSSPYVGSKGQYQGLIPLLRSRVACDPVDLSCNKPFSAFTSNSKDCTVGVDAHCDPATAVTWNVSGVINESEPDSGGTEWKIKWNNGGRANIRIVAGGGVFDEVNCSASGSNLLRCWLRYGRNCPPASRPCPAVQPTVTVSVRTGDNAGIAYRRVNKAALAAYAATLFLGASFQDTAAANTVQWLTGGNAGVAWVTTQWLLPLSSTPCNNSQCGFANIWIPSLYLEDNVVFQSRLREQPPIDPLTGNTVIDPVTGKPLLDLRWFLANNWHQLTYFAVAPDLIPGGAGTCSDTGTITCLQVANVSPPNKQRAILLLAGRSLAGASRPNATLADYLDPQVNCNGNPPPPNCNRLNDTAFEQRVVNRAFNDRVVVVDRNP